MPKERTHPMWPAYLRMLARGELITPRALVDEARGEVSPSVAIRVAHRLRVARGIAPDTTHKKSCDPESVGLQEMANKFILARYWRGDLVRVGRGTYSEAARSPHPGT